MKTITTLLIPAPLLAAITPLEIGTIAVILAILAWATHSLLRERLRERRMRREIQRWFERRARNSRSIRI